MTVDSAPDGNIGYCFGPLLDCSAGADELAKSSGGCTVQRNSGLITPDFLEGKTRSQVRVPFGHILATKTQKDRFGEGECLGQPHD